MAKGLSEAIDARLAGLTRPDIEARIDEDLTRFVDDPYGVKVTKDKVWQDAEKFYAIDPVFVGIFYAWIHVIDPEDMKALVYLGDALYAARNVHSAMRYYVEARRVDGGSALPLLRIGDVYNFIGNHEAALRAWREAELTNAAGEDEALYRNFAKQRNEAK